MTLILKMTDCAKKKLMQQDIGLMKCEDPCTKASFVSFNHTGLSKQINSLQSDSSKEMHQVMKDMFDGIESLQDVEFQQQPKPVIRKTRFNNPPTPRTKVPGNPCNDPAKGAPSAVTKRAAKCTIKKSPQCYKLQERFLLIQAGLTDERDDLIDDLAKMEKECAETEKTLDTLIADDSTLLGNAQTKLASAMQDEASAGETARQTTKMFKSLNSDLIHQMKACNVNYVNFETEICALKKIRGELFKMQGGGPSKSFFVDCKLTAWKPRACTKKCGGGRQWLYRGVLAHPNGGAKCLPRAALRSCNMDPCPVDCKLHAWSGWSKCSAECGGCVKQRLRDVKVAMKHDGKPCSPTSESKACNAQACEKACTLGRWTRWSRCSKSCDGGTIKRQRFIKKAAIGEGSCPGAWDKARLQYHKCNMHRCRVKNQATVMECKMEHKANRLDVVLMLDGSSSLGEKGWKAQMVAAQNFLTAFRNNLAVKMSVIVYAGPRTWSGVSRCMGNSNVKVAVRRCGINIVTHFTLDLKKVKKLVSGLNFPKGGSLVSLALSAAKDELSLGRKEAKSVVVAFTHARPLSFRKTEVAAKDLRKSARLIWVAVTRFAPLSHIRQWATRRWQENLVVARTYKRLETAAAMTQLIANMCPK